MSEMVDTTAVNNDSPVEATVNEQATTDGQSTDVQSLLAQPQSDTSDQAATEDAKTESDWRKKLAGDDDKLLKQLGRYASPDAFGKAYRELQKKLSSGVILKAPAEDAAPEELAQYRKALGVPDDISGYKFDAPLSDPEKPMVESLLKELHSVHAPPQVVAKIAEWYGAFAEEQNNQISETARRNTKEAEIQLIEEFGPRELKTNLTLSKRFLDDRVGDSSKITELTLIDGTPLGSNPEFIRMMTGIAREYASDNLINAVGGDTGTSIQARIDEIYKMSQDDPKKYASKAIQDELFEKTRILQDRSSLK